PSYDRHRHQRRLPREPYPVGRPGGRNMSDAAVSEIMVRGIVVGVFAENAWVIGNRRTGEAIAIDPGDQPEEILAMARDMGVTIKLIANSHAHIDHILGEIGRASCRGRERE